MKGGKGRGRKGEEDRGTHFLAEPWRRPLQFVRRMVERKKRKGVETGEWIQSSLRFSLTLAAGFCCLLGGSGEVTVSDLIVSV